MIACPSSMSGPVQKAVLLLSITKAAFKNENGKEAKCSMINPLFLVNTHLVADKGLDNNKVFANSPPPPTICQIHR